MLSTIPAQKFLFISNGHGEDVIGAKLAEALLLRAQELGRDINIEAVPIVGRGNPYERISVGGTTVNILGPRWSPPSGGFTFTSLKLLLGDLKDGMATKTHAQHWAVRNAKPDVVIVVGDVYALWVTFSFAFKDGAKPMVFQYQPLVSKHYQDGMDARARLERANRVTVDGFVKPELRWMQRVKKVWARDARTAQWLKELGVGHADFLGNIMMDVLLPEQNLDAVLDGRPVLALLPGTRHDFLFSLPRMLNAVELLPEFQVFAAFAGDATKIVLPDAWSWGEPTDLERRVSAQKIVVHKNGARVPLLQNAFASLLHKARVAMGTAGTANEQAVGLGVPVVGFPTLGPQYTLSFSRAQGRLLGAGLNLIEDASAVSLAAWVRHANSDELLRASVRVLGAERMGGPGAAYKIASSILAGL